MALDRWSRSTRNYGPDAVLSDAARRYVTLHEPDWVIDPDELRSAPRGPGRSSSTKRLETLRAATDRLARLAAPA